MEKQLRLMDTWYFHLCSFCGQSFEGQDEEEVKRIRFGGHDCTPIPGDRTLRTTKTQRAYKWVTVNRGTAVL